MERLEKPHLVPRNKVKQLTSPAPPPPLPPLADKAVGELVAKSPPEPSSTLQSRSSEQTTRRDRTAVRVLTYGALQLTSGVLMAVLGVLCVVHRSAMGRYGAGLWGGGAAVTAGLAGVAAGLRGWYHPGEPLAPTAATVYLALCLVTVAVTSLATVITSTGLLRDLHQPNLYQDITMEDQEGEVMGEPLWRWAPVLPSAGLLLITVLLLVSLLMSVLRLYRLVCPCTRPPAHRLLESPAGSHYKQGLVHNWLGQQTTPAPLLVYPPPLLMENGGLYTVPPSSIGYPQVISPLPVNPYMQRRRSPHLHNSRGRNSVTPDCTKRSRRQERPREREPTKEKEITDEQLEKTYTGLDREIAEEFISIAMTNPESSQRSSVVRSTPTNKVIDCIAPI